MVSKLNNILECAPKKDMNNWFISIKMAISYYDGNDQYCAGKDSTQNTKNRKKSQMPVISNKRRRLIRFFLPIKSFLAFELSNVRARISE